MVIKRTEVTEPIEWTVKYFVETLGVRLEEAEFIIAIHDKEITGDIEEDEIPRGARD